MHERRIFNASRQQLCDRQATITHLQAEFRVEVGTTGDKIVNFQFVRVACLLLACNHRLTLCESEVCQSEFVEVFICACFDLHLIYRTIFRMFMPPHMYPHEEG